MPFSWDWEWWWCILLSLLLLVILMINQTTFCILAPFPKLLLLTSSFLAEQFPGNRWSRSKLQKTTFWCARCAFREDFFRDFLPEQMASQKKRMVFQPSIFSCFVGEGSHYVVACSSDLWIFTQKLGWDEPFWLIFYNWVPVQSRTGSTSCLHSIFSQFF